jgi:hypothetical protein
LEGQIVGKRFTSIDLEIRIRRIASSKIKNIWPRTGMYLKKQIELVIVGCEAQ